MKLPRIARWLRVGFVAFTLLATTLPAYAADSAQGRIDSGDTAWVLIATALVMMMTAPGLALFYGGLVSRKNVLSTLMHSFFVLCLIGVQWIVWGYSIAFGADHGGLVGGLGHLLLTGVGLEPAAGTAIPHLLFALYQGMFAIITVALISGSFAERIHFKAFILFSVLWAAVVYDPLAHWVWGGGWLQKLGALDFAGGTVVHISSAVSALVAALVIGPRAGFPKKASHPHNIPLVLMGAGLLWFGWFGFNAGSALAANGLAVMAFATTNASAAMAGLVWTLLEASHRGKPSLVGASSGAVAGLVAITPAAGYVGIPAALVIGLGAAVLCYVGVAFLKPRFGYDDTLDVFGVHGLGGTWGAIATGLFASKAINPAGANGLFYGNPQLVMVQLVAVAVVVVLAASATFGILKLVALITPLRVSEAEETNGLDLSLHGEAAYGATRNLDHSPREWAPSPDSWSPALDETTAD